VCRRSLDQSTPTSLARVASCDTAVFPRPFDVLRSPSNLCERRQGCTCLILSLARFSEKLNTATRVFNLIDLADKKIEAYADQKLTNAEQREPWSGGRNSDMFRAATTFELVSDQLSEFCWISAAERRMFIFFHIIIQAIQACDVQWAWLVTNDELGSCRLIFIIIVSIVGECSTGNSRSLDFTSSQVLRLVRVVWRNLVIY